MPMAKITPVAGEAGLYHVHFLDARTDPGYGHGSGLHPSHDLPGGGHVSGGPVYPGGHPDQGLPGGRPGIPGNTLPDAPPPTLLPGYTLVMVRTADQKWHYAAVAPGSPPPRPLPEPIPPGGAPDQGLPPQPPTAAPKPA